MRKYYNSDDSHQETRLILGEYLKVCYEYFLLLTPQCMVFFFKLIVTKVVKKFLTYLYKKCPILDHVPSQENLFGTLHTSSLEN
jgi:hypothetical protein